MSGPSPTAIPGRRPLTSRDRAWARASAAWLARRGVAPNAISLVSMLGAALAAAGLALWPQVEGWTRAGVLLAVVAGIQLRLLCNLFDGMVAVEGGLRSPVGELYNEVPDRVSDTLILVAAGYGLAGMPYAEALGWAAALLAMLTAYVRAIGAGVGLPGCFHGPMAKQQRMAVLTVACLAGALLCTQPWMPWLLWSALALIAVGAALTTLRRLRAIAAHLRSRA